MTATIANGASESEAKQLYGYMLAAIQMSAGWTAADLSFEVSQDSSNWKTLKNDLGETVTLKVAAGVVVAVEQTYANALRAFPYFRLKSSVNQGAERVLTLWTL